MSDKGRTVTIWIDQDEWYPVYSVKSENRFDPQAEVSAETVERWERVAQAFEEMQSEMAEVYEAARERRDRADKIAKAAQAVAEAQKKLDALTAEQ